MAHSPLAQFEIKPIFDLTVGGINVAYTNSALWMTIIVLSAWAFMLFGTMRASLVPGRLQSAVETVYEFISNMLYETTGKEGMRFLPLVFSLFIFVLLANLFGLLPYAFTVTSHIAVTFALASLVFFAVVVTGFIRQGPKFLLLFVPSGVPVVMLLILVPIEFISFMIRPITLSVRLFGNMVAGHTMLKVMGGFIVALGAVGGWAPWLFDTALTSLEMIVAILQAYVFAMLTCIYLNDALHAHH